MPGSCLCAAPLPPLPPLACAVCLQHLTWQDLRTLQVTAVVTAYFVWHVLPGEEVPAIPEFSDNSTTLPSEIFLFKERDVGRGVVNNYSLFPPHQHVLFVQYQMPGEELRNRERTQLYFPHLQSLRSSPTSTRNSNIHTHDQAVCLCLLSPTCQALEAQTSVSRRKGTEENC